MIIGVPKEIKIGENRVGITPEGVDKLKKANHRILIEKGAGKGCGFLDEEYQKAGAEIVSKKEVWRADLILKIKEPLREEFQFFQARPFFIHLFAFGSSGIEGFNLELDKKESYSHSL